MIVFLGLSHLSLCYAASLLKLKKKIVIQDFKKEIEVFKRGENKIYEPDLEKILKKYSKNFLITDDTKYLKDAEIIFLAKDIATDKKNNINLKSSKKLLSLLNDVKQNKPLVIMNQVPVTFTRKINWKKNILYHFVETLVFGKAIDRASNPERIIIGKAAPETKIDQAFKKILNLYNCPIIELTLEESELTKGFINTYLASQLSTTNFLSLIAKYFNARWSRIFSAIGLDKRIGFSGYYNPGLGISGGNIERDLKTLSKVRLRYGIADLFPEFLLKSSKYYKDIIKRIIEKNKLKKILILGLTYKENTFSIKNSVQKELINSLKNNFLVHDTKDYELKKIDQIKKLKIIFSKLEDGLNNAKTVILFHNIKIYKKINFNKYKNIDNIIDPYSLLEKEKLKKKNYYSLTI